MRKAKIKITHPLIRALGKGAGLAVPALPLTTPVTAQLINLDNGKCWQSTFATATRSDSARFTASLP